MYRTFTRTPAIALALAGTFFSSTPAWSQEGNEQPKAAAEVDSEDPLSIDPIAVTGSRIYAKGGESIAPVLIFTGEELRQRGYTTLGDFSRNLNLNAGAITEFIASTGSPSFNLRGLGTEATLTLLNGRRVATTFIDQRVDLNSIPLSLVDRIEILKDGASAIYGADAIAGVVNIILQKDFLGTRLDTLYRDTAKGDASEYQVSLSFGRFIGTGSIWGFVNHYSNNALHHRDREEFQTLDLRNIRGEFADGRSDISRPGNIVVIRGENDIEFLPDPACRLLQDGPAGYSDRPNSRFWPEEACVYERLKGNTLRGDTDRTSLFAGFDFHLGAQTFFGDVFFNSRKSGRDIAPSPAEIRNGQGLFVSPDHPNNPYGAPVFLQYRFTDVGSGRDRSDWDFYRMVAGLRGAIDSWDYEISATFSEDDQSRSFLNTVSIAAVEDALQGRGGTNGNSFYNPFNGAENDPDVIAGIARSFTDKFKDRYLVVEAFAGRELFEWRHGVASLVVGAEYRDFDSRFTTGQTESYFGFGTLSDQFNKRDIKSAYAEVTLPVYKDFDVQLAIRHEDFSDFGNKTSPKIAARWQANRHLVLRGSYSEAFRAPDFFELESIVSTFDSNYRDPIRCADPALSQTPECLSGETVTVNRTGNRELDAETAKSTVLGFAFSTPGLESLAFDFDYWRFEYQDRIERLSTTFIADAFPDDSRFVVRAPPSPEDIAAGRPGPVLELNQTYLNLAVLEAEGYDAALTWETRLRRLGRIQLEAQATYFSRYEFKDSSVQNPGNRVGTNASFEIPRWRNTFNVHWSKGQNSATLTANRVHSWRELNPAFFEEYSVREYWTVDLMYERMLPRLNQASIRAGCINCFDEAPPRGSFGYGQLGYYDPRGLQLSVSYSQPF